MTPAFDIDGGLLSPVVQAVFVTGLLSLFGTALFRAWVMPRIMPVPAVVRDLDRLAWGSLALAGAGLAGWLVFESVNLGGSVTVLPVVAVQTLFGHLVLLQAAVLALTGLVLRRRVLACVLAGGACALQAGHGHVFSMYGGASLLLASGVLHVLAAGAWLGGLVPLLLVVRRAPPLTGAFAARWFSPLGKWCVAVMAGTAAFQGWVLVGSVPGLLGTGYGWVALAKLALFGVIFAFAWVNRYHLAPALVRGCPAAARRRLVRSIAAQTGFGLVLVAAAALLSSLPPAMHMPG